MELQGNQAGAQRISLEKLLQMRVLIVGSKKPSTSYTSFQQRRNCIRNSKYITVTLAKGTRCWWLAAALFFSSSTDAIKYRTKHESPKENPTADSKSRAMYGRFCTTVLTPLLMLFWIDQIICTVAGSIIVTSVILVIVCCS